MNRSLSMATFLKLRAIDYTEFMPELPARNVERRRRVRVPSTPMGGEENTPDAYQGEACEGRNPNPMLARRCRSATNPTVIEFPGEKVPDQNQVRVSPKTKSVPVGHPNFAGDDYEDLGVGMEPHFLPRGELTMPEFLKRRGKAYEHKG